MAHSAPRGLPPFYGPPLPSSHNPEWAVGSLLYRPAISGHREIRLSTQVTGNPGTSCNSEPHSKSTPGLLPHPSPPPLPPVQLNSQLQVLLLMVSVAPDTDFAVSDSSRGPAIGQIGIWLGSFHCRYSSKPSVLWGQHPEEGSFPSQTAVLIMLIMGAPTFTTGRGVERRGQCKVWNCLCEQHPEANSKDSFRSFLLKREGRGWGGSAGRQRVGAACWDSCISPTWPLGTQCAL